MDILIIGSGGREHAIAWKAAQNKDVKTVYCAPGNGGTHFEHKCINIDLTSIEDLKNFAIDKSIDLTIVGPEEPLTKGVVDAFKSSGLRVFGPSREAAQLEGSKIYAKNFMKNYGVKTAEYAAFDDFKEAKGYTMECSYPVVIKADGLAAGKGVVICEGSEEAAAVLEEFMMKDIFEGSGKKVVIEEFLEGVEASILSITDGEVILPFVSAKDHKQIYDGNEGPNTGGMGAIAPNPYCTEKVLKEFINNIMSPTLKGIQAEKLDYTGIIFFGLMITKKGVYLLEYNVRLGDPETQAVLSLMESDFVELIESAIDKKLSDYKIHWKKGHSCCLIAASGGYPGKYIKGLQVKIANIKNSKVFGAGIIENGGTIYTSGGRVLAVTSTGNSLEEAIAKAYEDIKEIDFEGIYYRKDIGRIY
ncbi:MAG: phosphoribosylamine--glycine ligase [Bacillota bacterium]|nr:phosphoribosylamine--glycine ligase [Bacillota bacterium]